MPDFVVVISLWEKKLKISSQSQYCFRKYRLRKDAFALSGSSYSILPIAKVLQDTVSKDNKLLRLKLPNSARNRQARHFHRQSDGCSRRSFIANYQGTYFY